MDEFTCPICGTKNCERQDTTNFYSFIKCSLGYSFGISDDIVELPSDLQDKLYNLIFEHLIRMPTVNKKYWYFCYDPSHKEQDAIIPPYFNLAETLQSYPTDFIERSNRTLLNLSIIYPRYGDVIGTEYIDILASYSEGRNSEEESAGLFDLMVDLGYLKHAFESLYTISAEGWKKVEALRKKQQEINQGFIAMSFREETKPIREAFRTAINESGYTVRIIDEKEHNNQIVPEIFYEIERSKFIVVDITYPNYGAYYEAGYAQGLGKQVIVCCKKTVFENKDGSYERPHFDISQKSMIIWDNEAELIEKLKRRIEATVI